MPNSLQNFFSFKIVANFTKNLQFIFSCDGTVKTLEKPLESDNAAVLLEHGNEIEAIVVDENLRFYCGKSFSVEI